MSFQNEEGLSLVEEVAEESRKVTTYPRALSALFACAVLAATAYTSYSFGVSARVEAQPVTTLLKLDEAAVPTTLNKHFAIDSSGEGKGPLPNDADGPLTNEGAHADIVNHHFHKFEYLNGMHMSGKFAIPGHGMAQDGSPIPDNEGYEGGKVDVDIAVDFFGDITKSYHQGGKYYHIVLGHMAGLNKEDNIVFVDGDLHAHDGALVEVPHHGSIMIACGLTDKIADYHMHSGHDSRLTIHSTKACEHDLSR